LTEPEQFLNDHIQNIKTLTGKFIMCARTCVVPQLRATLFGGIREMQQHQFIWN